MRKNKRKIGKAKAKTSVVRKTSSSTYVYRPQPRTYTGSFLDGLDETRTKRRPRLLRGWDSKQLQE